MEKKGYRPPEDAYDRLQDIQELLGFMKTGKYKNEAHKIYIHESLMKMWKNHLAKRKRSQESPLEQKQNDELEVELFKDVVKKERKLEWLKTRKRMIQDQIQPDEKELTQYTPPTNPMQRLEDISQVLKYIKRGQFRSEQHRIFLHNLLQKMWAFHGSRQEVGETVEEKEAIASFQNRLRSSVEKRAKECAVGNCPSPSPAPSPTPSPTPAPSPAPPPTPRLAPQPDPPGFGGQWNLVGAAIGTSLLGLGGYAVNEGLKQTAKDVVREAKDQFKAKPTQVPTQVPTKRMFLNKDSPKFSDLIVPTQSQFTNKKQKQLHQFVQNLVDESQKPVPQENVSVDDKNMNVIARENQLLALEQELKAGAQPPPPAAVIEDPFGRKPAYVHAGKDRFVRQFLATAQRHGLVLAIDRLKKDEAYVDVMKGIQDVVSKADFLKVQRAALYNVNPRNAITDWEDDSLYDDKKALTINKPRNKRQKNVPETLASQTTAPNLQSYTSQDVKNSAIGEFKNGGADPIPAITNVAKTPEGKYQEPVVYTWQDAQGNPQRTTNFDEALKARQEGQMAIEQTQRFSDKPGDVLTENPPVAAPKIEVPITVVPQPVAMPDIKVDVTQAPPLDLQQMTSSILWDATTLAATGMGAGLIYSQFGPQSAVMFTNVVSRLRQTMNEADVTRTYSDDVASSMVNKLQRGLMKYADIDPESHPAQILNPLLSQTENARNSITVLDAFSQGLKSGNQVKQTAVDFQNFYRDSMSPFPI
jgi:hypothetical protein